MWQVKRWLIVYDDNRSIILEIFWECARNPECHFPGIKEQLENTLSLVLDSVQEGDVLLTRHSNLSQTHVIFHLVVKDPTITGDDLFSPGDLELSSQSRLVSGLKAVAKLSYQYDVRHLTIPLLLLPEEPLTGKPLSMIASFVAENQSVLLKRCEIILKSMRGYLLENMYILKDPAIAEAPTARTITYALPRSHRSLFASIRSAISTIYKVN